MINQAYILSNLRTAIYQAEGEWYVVESTDLDQPRRYHRFDSNLVNHHEGEVLFIEKEQTFEELKATLTTESRKQEALTLALQLMDKSITEASLKEAIAELLAEYLGDNTLFTFIENRLFSVIPSDNFDPLAAAAICQTLNFDSLAHLYQELSATIESIRVFNSSWKKIAIPQFEEDLLIEKAFQLLSDKGIIKTFVQAIQKGNKKSWDNATFQGSLLLQKEKLLSNAVFFNQIRASLKDHYQVDFDKRVLESNEKEEEEKDEIAMMIDQYLEQRMEDSASRKSRKRGKKRRKKKNQWTDVEKVRDNVDFHSEQIVNCLFDKNEDAALRSLKSLIEYQLDKSAPEHICKSLCNIASEVLKSVGNTDFARRVVDYAKQFNYDDAVVFNIRAEIFKAEGKLIKAKELYKQIKADYPNNVFAQNGYAEVLKSLGDLEGAKLEYESIKEAFPYDVTARNSYAEVLKSLGDLERAKQEYEHINRDYPKNIISQTGYAGILKSLGDLEGAKREYEKIREEFPNNIIAQTGYAEVLKSLGDLKGAKQEYENINRLYPKSIISQNGYAEVLKSLGDLKGAKQEYQHIKKNFPNNVVSQNGYAEVLKSLGDLEGAKTEYEKTKAAFPNDAPTQRGYAEILKSLGDLEGAKREYERIKKSFPNDVISRAGYAELLKFNGELNQAKEEYEYIFKKFPYNQIVRRALVHLCLLTGEVKRFNELFKKVENPKSENDYYWHTLLINKLIKEGEWEEAKLAMIKALKICQFYSSKAFYKRTLRYLKIQQKEFETLLEEVEADPSIHPIDHVLNTHIYASLGKKPEAKKELENCKKHRQNKIIYEITCLLSERFNINGLPKQGLPIKVLDEKIKETELQALISIL